MYISRGVDLIVFLVSVRLWWSFLLTDREQHVTMHNGKEVCRNGLRKLPATALHISDTYIRCICVLYILYIILCYANTDKLIKLGCI